MIRLRQFEDVLYQANKNKDNSVEDKKEEERFLNSIKSECKLLFHFFHKLLYPFKRDANVLDKDTESDWFLTHDNIKQRLYLSEDAEKMLEVVQNRLAFLYWRYKNGEKQEKYPDDHGQLVKWKN